MRVDPPHLSIAERDRRWDALRGMMTQDDLEALLVVGAGRDKWDRYVSGEALAGAVLLGRTGPGVYLLGKFPLERFDSIGRQVERWIEDFRVGPLPALLATVLAECGLAAGRIGVVGLSSRSIGAHQGTIPFGLWDGVLSACPDVDFTDVADPFERLALVKGEEERAMVRHAALIGEAACEEFVAACRSGALESEPVAAALAATVSRGGWLMDPTIISRSGPGAFAWSPAEWTHMGGGSRILGEGDLVAAELFSCYGGYETQQQIQVSIGEPSQNVRFLVQVVEEAQRTALALLRPGILFSEVCDQVRQVVLDAGCWSTGPVLQTVSPVMFNDGTHENMRADPFLADLPRLPDPVPRDGDFVIEKGIAFAVQPNAIRGGDRICLGGTVLISDDGVEQLNDVPTRLQIV